MKVDVSRPKKLYRFSERKWLERSLTLGEFRLRPASHYRDIEQAAARQDDELTRVNVSKKGTFVMTLERTGEVIETLGDLTRTTSMDRDYYTLCFSRFGDPHQFKEFEGSDSCLIIHEPDRFMERLHAEIEGAFPGWLNLDAPVRYGNMTNPLGVPFTKHERFAFQLEHRVVVVPTRAQPLEPVTIAIGSIEAYAEIVSKGDFVAAI